MFRFFTSYSPVAQLVEQVTVAERPVPKGGMSKKKRTYSDRRQYIIDAVQKRRKKIRQMAVEYKGGSCEKCGYDRCLEALEFHHLDSSQKDFSISSKGYTRSWERVKAELDKCVMLCANCHREEHARLAALGRNAKEETKSDYDDLGESGLSQGNLRVKEVKITYGNPELAFAV